MDEYTIVECEYFAFNDGYSIVNASYIICLNDTELQTFEKLYSNKYFDNIESYSCSSKSKIPINVAEFINNENNKERRDTLFGIRYNVNKIN